MTTNYDEWAEIYDAVYAYRREDIPFYVNEAQQSKGPVLELGCGTGRIAIPIAQAGIEIVGMDDSEAMLEVASRKAARLGNLLPYLNFIEGDMRSFDLARKFELVIIPLNGFLALLTPEDQMKALECIRKHLSPTGRVVFDISPPDPHLLVEDEDRAFHLRDVTDPESGDRLVLWQQTVHDNLNQLLTVRLMIDQLDEHGVVARRLYRDYRMRYAHRMELIHLFYRCGFDVVELFGDFEYSAFDEFSEDMVWVLGLPSRRSRPKQLAKPKG